MVIFLSTHQLLVVESLFTSEVGLCLLKVQFGDAQTALRRTQRTHRRNDLDLGDHLAFLHLVTSLLVDLGYDAADLRLDVHLVTRLNGAGDEGGLLDVGDLGGKLLVADLLRT